MVLSYNSHVIIMIIIMIIMMVVRLIMTMIVLDPAVSLGRVFNIISGWGSF